MQKRKFLLLLMLTSLNLNSLFAQIWVNIGNGLGDEPYSALTYDLHSFNDTLYAGGRMGVEFWDGINWNETDILPGTSYITTIEDFDDTIYVGGSVPFGSSIKRIYKISGITWTELPIELTRTDGSTDYLHTQILFAKDSQLIVGGRFDKANGVIVNNIFSWDKTTIEPFGEGFDDQVLDVIYFNDQLIVTGVFMHSGEDSVEYIAKWNGEKWSRLDSNLRFSQYSELEIFNDKLLIANIFDTIEGIPMGGIAAWDGENFESMGDLQLTQIRDFQIYNGELYAAESIDNDSAEYYNYVVKKWDGTHWQQIGQSFNNYTLSLEEYRDELYCAGFFEYCDSDTANCVSILYHPNPTTDIAINNYIKVYPNPASSKITISSNHFIDECKLELINIYGEILQTETKIFNSAKVFNLQINQLPNGIYFLKFSANKYTELSKLVISK